MSIQNKNSIITVLGKTQSGKSTFLCDMIEENIDLPDTVFVVWDVCEEFSSVAPSPNAVKISSFQQIKKYIKEKGEAPLLIYVEPFDLEVLIDTVALLAPFCKIVVVFDEIDEVIKKQKMPPFFENLINHGRHYTLNSAGDKVFCHKTNGGISLVCAARRTTKIHNDLVSQASDLVIFLTVLSSDIKHIENSTKSRLSQAIDFTNLEVGQFVRFKHGVPTENNYRIEN